MKDIFFSVQSNLGEVVNIIVVFFVDMINYQLWKRIHERIYLCVPMIKRGYVYVKMKKKFGPLDNNHCITKYLHSGDASNKNKF